MPNFIEIGETTLEKSVTKNFHTLQYFGSPGGPPGPKVTGLSCGVHQHVSALHVATTIDRQICALFALLKHKMLSASWQLSLFPRSML